MEKYHVAGIAKKLSKNWSNLTLQEIYTKFVKEPDYRELITRLDGRQVIDLVFLIK